MEPDNPLLARAQAALKQQLVSAKERAEDELRAQKKLLADSICRRENLGVELFTFQQQLAKLQLDLDASNDACNSVVASKDEQRARMLELRSQDQHEASSVANDRARVESFQHDLDRHLATLQHIEAYNQQMKKDIAVTRRATYKAETEVKRVERDKLSQDHMINKFQEQLQSLHQHAALLAQQLDSQKQETCSALETLTEATTEMSDIHVEKRQLLSQWNSTLTAIVRREETLAALHDTLHKQQDLARGIANETHRFKKDLQDQKVQTEIMFSTRAKLEGQLTHTQRAIDSCKEKSDHMLEVLRKLEKSQEHIDGKLGKCTMEQKAATAEIKLVDKACSKVAGDCTKMEDNMMSVLGHQMTVENGSSGTVKTIRKYRQEVNDKEYRVVTFQNEVAKLSIDTMNTDSHNVKLQDTLKLLDEDLSDRAALIDRYEVEIRKRNDDIQKKTRTVDGLNRKLERMTCDQRGEETGPLEATVASLQREIQRKEVEGKELQRHWINVQTQLVEKQNENEKMSEAQEKLVSNCSILAQKRKRLEGELHQEQKEIGAAEQRLRRIDQDMNRLDNLIAKNEELQRRLQNDTTNFEHSVLVELKELEVQASDTKAAIQRNSTEKKQMLQEVLETEQEVLLWERKLQLERETQDVLNPSVGQDVLGSMKKEIHRMELRKTALSRTKEELITELEMSIDKRDTICVRGRANQAVAKKNGKLTEQALKKTQEEMVRSINDTEAERAATDERIRDLDARRLALAEQMQVVATKCVDLRKTDAARRSTLDNLRQEQQVRDMQLEVLATATKQVAEDEEDDDIGADLELINEEYKKLNELIAQVQDTRPEVKQEINAIHAISTATHVL